ncbi:MAG: GH3 auxin-responsive promoter family protein [Bacteroidetes bacterium]|nr:GH3 auxin-responsive promoter family protein [Bacteroidota bacterium]
MPILGSIIKKAFELRSKPVEKKLSKLNPVIAQQKELVKLLSKAQFTAIGEHYKFSKLLNSTNIERDFKASVAVHDYQAMYKRWWYRALNGETYVTWPGKVKYFALSSGTSEASSKYIPVTDDMLKGIKQATLRQLVSATKYDFPLDFYEKGILMIGGSTHLQYNGTYYEGDLSGITAGNIPFWFQHFYKPGRRISKTSDWATKLNEMVKKAPTWDIGILVGVPAWVQILMERIIEEYNLKTIHDIWPNLKVYVHSGVSFKPYVKSFEKLVAKPLMYNESYLSSEGYVAYQNRADGEGMEMILNNGIYYEFVPFTSENFDDEGNLKESPQALSIGDVELGKEYALLMTTNAGAWRYLLGDTIKFIDKKHSEIVITGRTKHFISICGEHLSQENMNRAIELMQEDLDIEVKEFTVAGVRHGSLFAHRWYIGTNDPLDPDLARQKIDEHLKNLNDDYRVERMEAIKDVFVKVLPTQVFYDYMKEKGREGSANKFPRVLKNSRFDEWDHYLKQHGLV